MKAHRLVARYFLISAFFCFVLLLSPGVYALSEAERDLDFVAGRTALDDGFYATAAASFERYISKNLSTRMKAYGSIFLFQAWFGQGEYNKIIEWLRQGWDISRGTRYEGASVYWYCRAKYAVGAYEDTLHHMREFEARFPGDEFLPFVLRLRGAAFRALKRFPEAEAVFARFDAEFPDRPEIPENLLDWAGVQVQSGKKDEARATYKLLVARYPDAPPAHQAQLMLGQWAIEDDDAASAVLWLQPLATNAMAAAGLRSEAWFVLARAAMEQKSTTNALAALQQGELLATNDERRVEARIDQARILMAANRLDDAVALMTDVPLRRGAPMDAARVQLEMADLLRAQGRYEQAADTYQRYVESFSDVAGTRHARLSRAWCLWELSRYAEAAVAFESAYQAVGNDRLREQALVKSAESYFKNEQYKLASAAFEKALQEFPQSDARHQMMFLAAESHARSGESDAAIRLFRAVANDASAEQELALTAWLRLARLHEEQQAWPEAMTVYDDILSRFKESERYPEAMLGRAVLLHQQGDIARAQNAFEELIGKYPTSAQAERAHFMRAWCAYQAGDTSSAIDMAQEFLRAYPESSWVPEVRFWLAEHAFNRQRFESAETNFSAIAAAYTNNALAAPALYWAGRAAMQQNANNRALEQYFNVLIKRYPASPLVPETRFSQGDALMLMNDPSGAILAFNEIILHYPDHALAVPALGRIGDCQFDLGAQRPDRYLEAIETYNSALIRAGITPELAIQIECKLARANEKIGRIDEAMAHYVNVVYAWMAAREQGAVVDDIWFVRAALNGAALKEASGAWDEAIRIYERVVASGIPAAADAKIRIDRAIIQREKTGTSGAAN